MPWFLRYKVEGVQLESGPYKTAEDAELWREQVEDGMPMARDVEVAWEDE